MGVETESMKIARSSMEEIEVFKNADSPTGERIKLFIDELEPIEVAGGSGHLEMPPRLPVLPLQACVGPGDLDFDLDFMVNLELDPDVEYHSGQEVQRISVINNLPDLLRDSHADCMRRVVPKVREVLHVAQADMQLAASSAFIQILRKDLVPVQNYAQTFLQTILSSVDNKDPDEWNGSCFRSPDTEIATAWLDTLLDVIDLLPKDIIKKEILTIAIEKGQLSQPVQTRLSCCKILGKIATRFEPFVIKKEILPVVQSLCQDVEYEVRGCMCLQLDPVSRGLGLEATKSAILPELVELTNDEESYVRIAGLQTVVNILTLVDEDTCRATLIPLVCKFCQQAMKTEDVTLPIVAKEIGRLAHGFLAYLTEEQKLWFVDFFKSMCRVGLSENKQNKNKEAEKDSPTKDQGSVELFVPVLPDILELEERVIETRRNCAFNFPAMVMFVGAKSFKAELGTCFSHLCKDPNVEVRKTLSSGFHEISGMMGSHVNNLLGDLIVLLKDENTEVLKGVVTHLPDTITSICGPLTHQAMHEAKQNQIADIIPAILSAELVIASSNDWRLQEMIVEHFRCFQYLTNSENIYNKIIPVLMRKLRTARAMPVRLAATRSTLSLVRNIKKMEQRSNILCTLVEDFCHGYSCRNRSLFIDICRVTIEYYSKAYFKETFFESLVSLHTDPIPNIRYRLCSVLPDLKRIIKLPSDKMLHQLLDSCVRRLLIGEKDRDVALAVKIAVEEMDKIPVQMESALTRRIMMEEDVEDQKKEADEKRLIELEERELKKEEEAAKAKADKKGMKDNASKIPAPKKSKGSVCGKSERESAGIKRTPSTTNSTTSTSTTVKANTETESRIPLANRSKLARTKSDSAASKLSSTKTSRSGVSGVPTPSSAGSRKSSVSKMAASEGAQRRASISSPPISVTEKGAVRKNSNGSIPVKSTKKTK
ncbi:serine/threonine-protein phosphatase 4 regulatory subunit 4-like isoform X2 [Mya arenaria]|uniref:serine/threonine-protein phosphatase 4 regulatory subunit 4-like isoform X3 n=1 Tax=Mya arenaria TaxID=6604 RepID=UPI0022DEE58C|nr:serine/threonine-protein phosphatase 4 regulatory subunit 4-like isoform X3 [Mya arenaria]XP_052768328.1 serine/threonine-protein phosphatase 4 regulatory subunit 4-like isoform X2 [Mya arenaria]